MKVSEKVIRAKESIHLISTHDDVPMEDVEAALDELNVYIESEKKEAVKRREKREAQVRLDERARLLVEEKIRNFSSKEGEK